MKKSRLVLTKKKGDKFFFGVKAAMSIFKKNVISKYKLNYIQIKDGRLAVSDGVCLCVVDIPEHYSLEDGYYLPLVSTKTQIDIIRDYGFDGEYPDVDKILSINQGDSVDHVFKCCQKEESNLSGNYTEVVRRMHDENTLSISLFKKFLDFDYVEVPKYKNCMLKFHSSGVVAVLMPINI